MKARRAMVTIIACLAAASAFARANSALDQVLDQLATQAPADQVARLREAIGSSPSLRAQMDALAASGQLKHVAIGEAANQVPRQGPFSAWLHDDTWAFTGDFIGKHGRERLHDVVQPDDILPDNLVFVLGHMAYEAKTANEITAKAAAIQASYKSQASAGNNDATSALKQWVSLRIDNDAAATIQAWDDTVDAAQHTNGDKPLSTRQAAGLVMNLRYRSVLIKAMQAAGDDKLAIGNDGRVEMTPANIAAISKALSTSSVLDVQ